MARVLPSLIIQSVVAVCRGWLTSSSAFFFIPLNHLLFRLMKRSRFALESLPSFITQTTTLLARIKVIYKHQYKIGGKTDRHERQIRRHRIRHSHRQTDKKQTDCGVPNVRGGCGARRSTSEFASLTRVRHNSRQFIVFIENLAGRLIHHTR